MEAKKRKRATKTRDLGFINEKSLVFGENVRLARKERGFTSDVLAKFLGISTAYVGLIERGERCPSLETFLRICDFFGEPYEDMIMPNSAFAIAEKTSLIKSAEVRDQVKRRQKMLASMINTFDIDELNHLINIVKSFKQFNMMKDNGAPDGEIDPPAHDDPDNGDTHGA